jgi:hypothetical protein
MKKVMAMAAFLAVALVGGPPATDAIHIPVGAVAGTKITNVPCTITAPGFYYLAQNLTYAPIPGNAITVQADDVTLDLMGFSLIGIGRTSDGIVFSGIRSNVEIRNGTIRGFSGRGIYASDTGCKGLRIISLRIMGTAATGIDITGTNHLVIDCSVKSAGGHGIYAGLGSLVKGNVVINNTDYGIKAGYGSNVVGNVAAGNSRGIAALPASSVTDNAVSGNSVEGISAADYCTITRNTAYNNTGTGIATGNYCTITNNTTDGLTYGSNCNPVDNTVTP